MSTFTDKLKAHYVEKAREDPNFITPLLAVNHFGYDPVEIYRRLNGQFEDKNVIKFTSK